MSRSTAPRCPADIAPLLIAALVDDSQKYPDLFELRFRDPAHLVLPKSGAKVGSAVKISVSTGDSKAPLPLMTGEITALQSEFDSGGTFTVLRGYDAAHRLFRGRRTEAYTQMTASDIALKVAQRAGLQSGEVTSTTTVYEHVSQAGTSDWDLMQRLAADVGYEVTVREGKFGFGPPTAASGAPPPGGAENKNPLVLKLGADLLRFRAVVTSSEQVKEVEVRGWDTATKQALTATQPAATTSVVLPDTDPAKLAKTFGDARYVADRRPAPHPGRGGRRGRGAGRGGRGFVRRVRGRRPGQPRGARRRGDHHGRPRLTVRREVHRHHVAAPARPDHRLHDVVLGDRRPGPHHARASRAAAARPRQRPRASSSPSSTTSTTRRRPAACGCASRGSTTPT